jgi:hypothetical protein
MRLRRPRVLKFSWFALPCNSSEQLAPDVTICFDLIIEARAVRREGKGPLMKKQFMFERECIHREDGTDGDQYNGMFFVQALQRLQTSDAMKMARKVTPFYWVDAPRVVVWLCRECASELHISDAPRAVLQGARR